MHHQSMLEYKERSKELSKNSSRVSKFGISTIEYDGYRDMADICPICGVKMTNPADCPGVSGTDKVLDHDHFLSDNGKKRESVRGFVCSNCNKSVLSGMHRTKIEHIEWLKKAIEWIENEGNLHLSVV